MKKDFGVKTWLYPMPVLMIATYNEDGSPNVMNAAWGGTMKNCIVWGNEGTVQLSASDAGDDTVWEDLSGVAKRCASASVSD